MKNPQNKNRGGSLSKDFVQKILLVTISVGTTALLMSSPWKNDNTEKQTTKNNQIAYYIEDDNGQYTLSSSNKFPTEGYVLNLEKSTCTNGGKLSQNPETKALSVSVTSQDKCNVYFSKITPPALSIIKKLNIETKGTLNTFNDVQPPWGYSEGFAGEYKTIQTANLLAVTQYYYTAADSYTFDTNTGKYSLVNPRIVAMTKSGGPKYIIGYQSAKELLPYENVDKIYKMSTSATNTLSYRASSKNIVYYESSENGVYEMEDDYGVSYYYRGSVTNNYIKFAGFYWRIIRVNGDGSLRIIYDGTSAHANGESSDDRFIKVSQPFNAKYDDAKYVGWMYGPANVVEGTTTASTSKAEAQTNTANSDIKTVVDEWYKTNIQDKGYGQYVSDTLFCNDRSTPGSTASGWSSDTGLGYGTNATAYGAYARFYHGGTSSTNYNNPQPTFRCGEKNDAFTVNDTEKGNGALTYPVGLITADEIAAAGGKYGKDNKQYYLYRSSRYYIWSFSPYSMHTNGSAYVFAVNTYGYLHVTNANSTSGAVAPVINLSAEYVSTLKGTGTMTDPYTA